MLHFLTIEFCSKTLCYINLRVSYSLFYVNDIVLLSGSLCKLEIMLNICRSELSDLDFSIFF